MWYFNLWIQTVSNRSNYLHIKTFTFGKTHLAPTLLHLHCTFKLNNIWFFNIKHLIYYFKNKINILWVNITLLDREYWTKIWTLDFLISYASLKHWVLNSGSKDKSRQIFLKRRTVWRWISWVGKSWPLLFLASLNTSLFQKCNSVLPSTDTTSNRSCLPD